MEGHNKVAVANLQANLSDVALAHRATSGAVRCSIEHGHYGIISLGIETHYILYAGRPGQDLHQRGCLANAMQVILPDLDRSVPGACEDTDGLRIYHSDCSDL
jgi:hypothetical protein